MIVMKTDIAWIIAIIFILCILKEAAQLLIVEFFLKEAKSRSVLGPYSLFGSGYRKTSPPSSSCSRDLSTKSTIIIRCLTPDMPELVELRC